MSAVITHKLKIHGHWYIELCSGLKKAEIRFNDRNFKAGQFIDFIDVQSEQPWQDTWEITHVLSFVGLKEGYVCLSLKRSGE